MGFEKTTKRSFDMAISRIFNANIKNHKKSLSRTSIENKLAREGYHILEIYKELPDSGAIITIASGWRKHLKTMNTMG